MPLSFPNCSGTERDGNPKQTLSVPGYRILGVSGRHHKSRVDLLSCFDSTESGFKQFYNLDWIFHKNLH
jgi:hypothetical protein